MRIDRFTSKLQEALADAQSVAVGKDNNQIAPVHLVSALVTQKGGSIGPLIAQMGIDIGAFQPALENMIERLPKIADNVGDVQMSPELGRMLNLADKLAQEKSDQFISSE